jgi:amidase
MDLSYATASELVAALATGDLSSVELVDHVLARIDEVNPPLNAVVHVDPDRARRDAKAADAARARGEDLGPLHGLAITVKDVWETEGMVTTSGAPELRDHVPTNDAVAVARLRAAGAVVVGKTNTPLYAGDNQTFNEVYGRTNNPWAVDRTTGGSSGGAAAAVAAGITPFELGSDIGGSIRVPAHFCGVYGHKPSWRVVPSRGHIPGPPGSLLEPDVNQGGPLARSVADLRLGLDVLAGPLDDEAVGWTLDLPEGDDVRSFTDLRVGVTFDDTTYKVSSEVQAVLRAFVDRLSDAGAKIDEQPPPVPMVDAVESWQCLVLPIIGAGLPDDVYDAFSTFDPDDPEPLIRSGGRLAMGYRDRLRADQRRQEQRQVWHRWFAEHDVFLTPIMPTAAFLHDTDTSIQERTLTFDGHTTSGIDLIAWAGAIGAMLLPATVIPAGSTPDGLPVGIQLVGPYLQDRRLLRIAEAFDALGPGFRPPPGF